MARIEPLGWIEPLRKPINRSRGFVMGFAELVVGPATSGRTRWLNPILRPTTRQRLAAYLTVITRPLRSALTIAPTDLPLSVSIAPCWLVSTIACAPRPTAAPTLPAA
jgi:hypothetical protein